MQDSIETERPNREPDFRAPPRGYNYAIKYWHEENIIGFERRSGWIYYSRFKARTKESIKSFTPNEYLEMIIADKDHHYHSEFVSFIAERELLS